MCSCVFCYFAGLWLVASRFGLIKILTRYGISEMFDQIPKDFPNIVYLYYGLVAYTILYIVIVCIIYKVTTKADKEQDTLQQQAGVIVNYAEKTNVLIAAYVRYAKANNITDKAAEQKLKMIQRQIASLPSSIVNNSTATSTLTNLLIGLQNQLSPDFDYAQFCAKLDSTIDTINSLKHKSVIIH